MLDKKALGKRFGNDVFFLRFLFFYHT